LVPNKSKGKKNPQKKYPNPRCETFRNSGTTRPLAAPPLYSPVPPTSINILLVAAVSGPPRCPVSHGGVPGEHEVSPLLYERCARFHISTQITHSLPLIVPPPPLDDCVMGCRSGGRRREAVRGRAAAAHSHRSPRR
jgi:hypothetical protein